MRQSAKWIQHCPASRAFEDPAAGHLPGEEEYRSVPAQLIASVHAWSAGVLKHSQHPENARVKLKHSQHPENARVKLKPGSAAYLGVDLLGAGLEGGAGAALRRRSALAVGHDAVVGAARAGARARALRAGARGGARLGSGSGRGRRAARARAGGCGCVRAALPAGQGLAARRGARQARRGRAVAAAAGGGGWGERQACM